MTTTMMMIVMMIKIVVAHYLSTIIEHDNNNDYEGLPAYSHHDRFPPWWVFVCDDNGGNMSGDKIPPLMMIMIRHLTHFNLSRSFVMLLPDCIDTALNTPRQKTISHLLKF